jgi:hypothetical protein
MAHANPCVQKKGSEEHARRTPETGFGLHSMDLKLGEKTGRVEDFVSHTIHECLHLVIRLDQKRAFKTFQHEDAMSPWVWEALSRII